MCDYFNKYEFFETLKPTYQSATIIKLLIVIGRVFAYLLCAFIFSATGLAYFPGEFDWEIIFSCNQNIERCSSIRASNKYMTFPNIQITTYSHLHYQYHKQGKSYKSPRGESPSSKSYGAENSCGEII